MQRTGDLFWSVDLQDIYRCGVNVSHKTFLIQVGPSVFTNANTSFTPFTSPFFCTSSPLLPFFSLTLRDPSSSSLPILPFPLCRRTLALLLFKPPHTGKQEARFQDAPAVTYHFKSPRYRAICDSTMAYLNRQDKPGNGAYGSHDGGYGFAGNPAAPAYSW